MYAIIYNEDETKILLFYGDEMDLYMLQSVYKIEGGQKWKLDFGNGYLLS